MTYQAIQPLCLSTCHGRIPDCPHPPTLRSRQEERPARLNHQAISLAIRTAINERGTDAIMDLFELIERPLQG